MQLGMGSTPAPGVASRRPCRVACLRGKQPNGESGAAARIVTGEGASHDARGGRAPLHLHSYALAGDLFSREPDVGDLIDQYLQLLKLGRFGRVGVCAQLQGAADVRAEG